MEDAVKMLSVGAKYVMEVDMFPAFFLAHFAISNIVVREDSKHLGPKFQQKHPFTSWLCVFITGLSGVFVTNFLFGDPLLEILQENVLIGFLTVIWYLMNYSPYDVVYKVMTHPVIFVNISVLQECLRCRVVYLGLQKAASVYPNAPLIILMGGIISGNGYGFIKIVERLIRGHWTPKTNEFLELSYFTKSGVVASCVFLLHHYKFISLPIEFLYMGIVVAFIIGRLILVLGGVGDPLAVIGTPICRLLFGSCEEDKPGKSETKGSQKSAGGDNKNNNKSKSSTNGKKKSEKKTN